MLVIVCSLLHIDLFSNMCYHTFLCRILCSLQFEAVDLMELIYLLIDAVQSRKQEGRLFKDHL